MSLRRRILFSSESNGQRLSAPPPPAPSRQLPSHVIIVVASVAAASVFLAIVYYAVLRHRRRQPLFVGRLSSGGDTSATSSDNTDHPIWHIKTVGLDDSAIESIGSYAHRGGAAADCSVCLGELLDGETVRLLPQCGHVFHVQCIDTWLRSHVSCPLCRAAVVVASLASAAGADVEGPPAADDPQLNEEEVAARVSVENSPEVPESSEMAAGALRSISMDSAAIGGILFRVDKEKEGNCSKEECSEKAAHSESGRGFLFSRLGRARSSSLLPL